MQLGGNWTTAPLDNDDLRSAHAAVEAAVDEGITVFDHADIYTHGKSEQAFAQVLKQDPTLRREIIIQSKCGIRFTDDNGPKRYDLSPEWIQQSVENTLNRLGIEQLDVLLLHRPDPLMDRDAVARCLDGMIADGKIAHVGVSNVGARQLDFLQSALYAPIIVNQLQLSLAHRGWIEDGIMANVSGHAGSNVFAGAVDHCVEHGVQVQAWSPLDGGLYTSSGPTDDPAVTATRELVAGLAAEYGCPAEALLLAWVMRHPAAIQPVIGTTNPDRIRACCRAEEVTLEREHWYSLLESARGAELP